MIAAVYHVRLTVRGPVLTQSTARGRFGLDAVMARSNGHFYLPGALIKGLVNEAWQELSCIDVDYEKTRVRWLGSESTKADDTPERALLFFEDLLDPTPAPAETSTRFRIEIDDTRGSVEFGHYVLIEAPYHLGAQVTFEGTLRALCADDAEVEQVRVRVQTALRWTASVGAERSVGFGRVITGVCTLDKKTEWQDSGPQPQQHRGKPRHGRGQLGSAPAGAGFTEAADLVLRFSRPLCFTGRRTSDNLFESEPWISGGALKGALATLLTLDKDKKLYPTLRKHLHAVRFTHALPAPAKDDATRPAYPPLSLITTDSRDAANKQVFYDAIYLTQEEMFDAATPLADNWKSGAAPSFDVDWKGDAADTIADMFGWASLPYELRVRTAIDGATRRANENKLFAYKMIVPNGVLWRAQVLLWGVDQSVRADVAAELRQALTPGLFALGKTKAYGEVTLANSRAANRPVLADATVAISLQSAALLCDPSRHLLTKSQPDKHGSTDRTAMWNEYAAVWRELSDDALELRNYFHRQTLAGGGYLRRRFQSGRSYRPYLLTEAGSVFLLTIKDHARAITQVTTWMRRGLPLSPAVQDFYGLTGIPDADLWKHCPYLPENGFGEIAVNVRRPGIVLLKDARTERTHAR